MSWNIDKQLDDMMKYKATSSLGYSQDLISCIIFYWSAEYMLKSTT